MKGDPAISLDKLVPYYRGIYYATIALQGRLAKLGPETRPAVREIGRYQAMTKSHLDALVETRRMQHDAHARSSP